MIGVLSQKNTCIELLYRRITVKSNPSQELSNLASATPEEQLRFELELPCHRSCR
jgi:hypothetical protein